MHLHQRHLTISNRKVLGKTIHMVIVGGSEPLPAPPSSQHRALPSLPTLTQDLLLIVLLWWVSCCCGSCSRSPAVVGPVIGFLLWWVSCCGAAPAVVGLLLWWVSSCGESSPVVRLLLWWVPSSDKSSPLEGESIPIVSSMLWSTVSTYKRFFSCSRISFSGKSLVVGLLFW